MRNWSYAFSSLQDEDSFGVNSMREEGNPKRMGEYTRDFILPLICLLFLLLALPVVVLAIFLTWFLILETIFKVFPNLSFEFAFVGSLIINSALWAILIAEKFIRRKLKGLGGKQWRNTD